MYGQLMLYCFEHSFKQTHRTLIGTCVFTQNLPVSIFEQINLRVLAELNMSEITCIACVHITTRNFPSSLNRAVS